MRCPFCNANPTRVLDSRETGQGSSVRRRRTCPKCGSRFSTYEMLTIVELLIVKRSGKREVYDRDKLRHGISLAFEKRPKSEEMIGKALMTVEGELIRRDKSEIPSRVIGKMVLETLKKLDEVAYLRFASVYQGFGSAKSFRKALDEI